MNGKQKEFLAKSGINLTDGLIYFSENERLYEKYLFRFLEEPTFPELFKAIEEDRRCQKGCSFFEGNYCHAGFYQPEYTRKSSGVRF